MCRLRVSELARTARWLSPHRSTPSVCTALSLEQAPVGHLGIHVSKQAINQSIMHAHPVWKGKVVTVSVPPRPDLKVHSQTLVVFFFFFFLGGETLHVGQSCQ